MDVRKTASNASFIFLSLPGWHVIVNCADIDFPFAADCLERVAQHQLRQLAGLARTWPGLLLDVAHEGRWHGLVTSHVLVFCLLKFDH